MWEHYTLEHPGHLEIISGEVYIADPVYIPDFEANWHHLLEAWGLAWHAFDNRSLRRSTGEDPGYSSDDIERIRKVLPDHLDRDCDEVLASWRDIAKNCGPHVYQGRTHVIAHLRNDFYPVLSCDGGLKIWAPRAELEYDDYQAKLNDFGAMDNHIGDVQVGRQGLILVDLSLITPAPEGTGLPRVVTELPRGDYSVHLDDDWVRVLRS